jgi:hypothetical protein
MSTTFIEPPPKDRGMGCLGKGCLLIIAFLLLLAVSFIIGFYAGTKPKPIPQVQASEQEQNAIKARWDEFETAARNEQISAAPPSSDATPFPQGSPVAEATPASGNRLELTANDVNQLISRGRHTRGRGFVTIDGDVAHVQVSVPLDKMGMKGRYLNGQFSVRSAPDHSPRNLQISEMSFSGVPDSLVHTIMAAYPPGRYVDSFVNEHGITALSIENGKVILETNGNGR